MALNTTFVASCEADDDNAESADFVYSLYYTIKGERKVYISHKFDPSDFSEDSFYLPPGSGELPDTL